MAICRHLCCKLKLTILPLGLVLLFICLPGCVEEFNMKSNSKKDTLAISSIWSSNRGINYTADLVTPSRAATQKQPAECEVQVSEANNTDLHLENVHRTGFVLALNFHEQQTQAVSNLFALQCWAKTLLVNIVEPFMVDSYFTFPMNQSSREHQVKFSDVFNSTRWRRLSKRHKLAPLASWKRFIADAPRRLVVVRFRYLKPKEYKLKKKMGEERVHRSMNDNYKTGCHKSVELRTKLAYMVEVLNFTVVRDVCLNFAHGDQLTVQQFNRHVYGGIRPKTVSILMEEWRGFSAEKNGKRISLFDGCWLSSKVQPMLYATPSSQLVCDAHRYRRWYLRTDSYISLVVRTEKMHSLGYDHAHMSLCLNHTLTTWKRLKKATNIQTTFLSMDIGIYGSYTLMERKGDARYAPFKDLYADFLKKLFGPHSTLRMWEFGFEEAASELEPGYVASLQKTIAAMGRCVLLSGGGSFQKHLLHLHKISHRNARSCVVIMEDCSRGI